MPRPCDGTPRHLRPITTPVIAAAPADDPQAERGRWILSDCPTRRIASGFTVTHAEAARLKAEWLKSQAGRPEKRSTLNVQRPKLDDLHRRSENSSVKN